MAEPSFDWHTGSLNLASALAALLLPVRLQVHQDVLTGKVLTLFEIGAVSVDGQWQRDALLGELHKKRLEAEQPHHPLLQGLRALRNYEALLQAQRTGEHLRLVGVAGSHASEYRVGQEVPELVNARALYQTADLGLCAALGTLGLPVVKIQPAGGGRHFYQLPALGHVLLFRGQHVRHQADMLAQRVAPGSYDLLLERTDPAHPMVSAYNATACRAQLKKALNETGRVIVHRHPRAPMKKMAITSENPAENVKKKLREHLS